MLLTLYELDIIKNINEFKRTTGKEVTEFQCNINTYKAWCSMFGDKCVHPIVFEELPYGVGAYYMGIPIEINNNLEDGVIDIK